MTGRDYAEIGWQYARDVVAGNIPAGSWCRKACQRSLDDLQGLAGFRFDETKAHRVCAFVERLSHVKGRLGGKLIQLQPWQVWVLINAFGWVHDGGHRDGLRRFRQCYLELGRGNGKSCLSSAIGLYMLAADGGYGNDCYSSATTAAQARIVFDDARAMARAPISAKLMKALGVETHAHTITVATKNSKFAPTASEYSTMDGFNISLSILDELHAMPDRGLWDVIVTGAGKRPESLIWSITTAGSDRSGICYEQRTYLTKLLDKVAEDNATFGCIWAADDDDDWQDEQSWLKANPNFNISVESSYIAGLALKARQMPAAQSAFRTKHLCQWVSTDSAWMNMFEWSKCHDPEMDIADFAGESCIIGLDLASKVDIAAKVKLFRREIADEQHYFVFGSYYLPEMAIQEGRNAQYPGWQVTGLLTSTPGNVIDFQQIEDELMDDHKRFRVEEVAYDPWQSEQLAQRLTAGGANMIEYRPTVQNFSAPMKEIDALVRSNRLHHNDPILSWMVSNVVCHVDNKDNIFPKKERPENKIDGIVALIMALGRWMAQEFDSVYSQRGLLVLSGDGSYTSR